MGKSDEEAPRISSAPTLIERRYKRAICRAIHSLPRWDGGFFTLPPISDPQPTIHRLTSTVFGARLEIEPS